MLIPFNVDVPMERVPVANWIVIGITILVSLLVMAHAPDRLPIKGPARYVILQRGDGFHLVQLVGHVLVHGGWFHLLGNMVFLFCFGNAINAKFGHAATESW